MRTDVATAAVWQMAKKAKKLAKVTQRKMNLGAKKGEADRRILTSKPRHLFAGKRKLGKTNRRWRHSTMLSYLLPSLHRHVLSAAYWRIRQCFRNKCRCWFFYCLWIGVLLQSSCRCSSAHLVCQFVHCWLNKINIMFHCITHDVESCPLTKLNGGLSRLHSADEDAVSWPTNYG